MTPRWFRCYEPRPGARIRLFCFPHAGGTATSFRAWTRDLPPEIELHAIELPGRENRLRENAFDQMPLLADAVAEVAVAMLDRPAAFFGHSLGAFVAYEVVHRLEAWRRAPVARLFASGQTAPHRRRGGTRHLWSDDRLWDELRRLGGTDSAVLDDPFVREVVLPALRSDYRLGETYDAGTSPALLTPISILVSEEDPEVTIEEAQAWCERTRGDCTLHRFPGDHFYLTVHEPVVDAICRDLGVARQPLNR